MRGRIAGIVFDLARRGTRCAASGQAMVFMALVIVALMGMAGLVADGGIAFATKARLQATVDAAALAAAPSLPNGAYSVACDYVLKNPVLEMAAPGGGSDCSGKADVNLFQVAASSVTNDAITVTAERTIDTTFMRVLGINTTTVSASATARIGGLGSACIFPFYLTIGQATPTDDHPMWSIIAIDRGSAIDMGSGSRAVRDAMVPANFTPNTCKKVGTVRDDLVDVSEYADPLDLKPGADAQFLSGWQDRFANVATSACPNADATHYRTADGRLAPALSIYNCPRLIPLPVLPNPPGYPTSDYKGNEKDIPLRGFAGFYVAGYCENAKCNNAGGTGRDLQKGDAWGYLVPLPLISDRMVTYKPGDTAITTALWN